MQCSDREAQFKQFKKQCAALCRAARPALADIVLEEKSGASGGAATRELAAGERPHSSNEHGRSVLDLASPSTLARSATNETVEKR